MPRFIAFLRAINVGGTHAVKMDTLRQLFQSLGFAEVATFIASGNVVFETTTIEQALDRPFTIRGAKTVQKMAAKHCSTKA